MKLAKYSKYIMLISNLKSKLQLDNLQFCWVWVSYTIFWNFEGLSFIPILSPIFFSCECPGKPRF